MKLYVATACVTLAASMAFADAVAAQTVRQRTSEATLPPGIQKPDYDPGSAAMSALILKVDALQQSAGRQVVMLHFSRPENGGWQFTNPQAYDTKAMEHCKEALGDRYGRVISRVPAQKNSIWYLERVVCETAP